MGSRMETLSASSAPPTTTELPTLTPVLCTSSTLQGVPLIGCHMKCNRSYCGDTYLPVPKGVNPDSQCKPAWDHHFSALSRAFHYSCRHQVLAIKSLDESSLHCLWSIEKGRNGVEGQKLSAELNRFLSSMKELKVAQFQPTSHVTTSSMMHRFPMGPVQSPLVHSLAKACKPFVLEVSSDSKIKKPDNFCESNEIFQAGSNASLPLQSIAKESAGLSGVEQEASHIDTVCDPSLPLPCDSLASSCPETAVSISEEGNSSSSIDTSGPGDVRNEANIGDISCSSASFAVKDYDSEDDEVTVPDDDQTESDCEFSDFKPQEESGSKIPEPPACSFLSVPCTPLKKLLSDESGFYEGTCSDEDGASWWQVGPRDEIEEEEEIDWDADDSGSEVDVDEKLLQAFEDLALSPQVLSDSPRPPAQPSCSVASDSKSGHSMCSVESPLCNVRRNGLAKCVGSTCGTSEHRNKLRQCSPLTSCGGDSGRCTDDEADTPLTSNQSANVSTCQELGSMCLSPKKAGHPTKRVHFPDDAHLVSVHSICAWSFAYRAARKGPWEQFARDRAHFKRRIEMVAMVLEPCLAAGRAAKTEHVFHSVVS